MNFIIKLMQAMVKNSGHALELVKFLVPYLTTEHVQEISSLINPILAATPIGPEVLAAETIATEVVAGVQAVEAAVETAASNSPPTVATVEPIEAAPVETVATEVVADVQAVDVAVSSDASDSPPAVDTEDVPAAPKWSPKTAKK